MLSKRISPLHRAFENDFACPWDLVKGLGLFTATAPKINKINK